MEILINDNRKVKFNTLMVGATFIDKEYDEDTIFMVVEPSIEVNITPDTDLVDIEEFCGYAVDLKNGGVMGYGPDEMVIPVKANVIANI